MLASATHGFSQGFCRSDLGLGPKVSGQLGAGEPVGSATAEERVKKKVPLMLGSFPKFPASEISLGQDKDVCEIGS